MEQFTFEIVLNDPQITQIEPTKAQKPRINIFYFSSGTAVVFKVFCFFVSSQLLPCLKLAKKFNISLAVREDSKEKPNHSWLCKMENGVLFPLSSI